MEKLKEENKEYHFFKINLEIKFLIFISAIIAYLIALSLKSNIPYHTDSIVPIEQIKSLVNSNNVSISDIRLARIPSIFPDLFVLFTLINFIKIDDIYSIIGCYSVINSFLILLGFILILNIIFKDKISFLTSSYSMLLINTLLIKNSFWYREIYGHFLTPLHQGGNIIMTIYSFLFIIYNIKKGEIRLFNKKINYIILPILISFSLISNKLYLFTFILPMLIIIISNYNNFLIIKSIKHIKKICAFIVNDISKKIIYKNLFVKISIPLFLIINCIPLFLNTQPMPAININLYSNLIGFKNIASKSIIFSPLSILYLILIIFSIIKINIDNSKKVDYIDETNYTSYKQPIYYPEKSISILFIGLFGLAPFAYIWFTESVISRYLLAIYLLAPLALSVLICLILENIKHIFNILKLHNRLIIPLCISILISSIILLFNQAINYYEGSNYTYSSWPVRTSIKNNIDNSLFNRLNIFKSLRQAALIAKSDFAVDHEQIHSLGLRNGLSDYWGTAVSIIGPYQIKVSPINPDGRANLWGNSKFDFRVINSNEIINFNFVYSRDYDFTKSIIDSYGKPSSIYQLQTEISKPELINFDELDKSKNLILIYKQNSQGWNKIQELVGK